MTFHFHCNKCKKSKLVDAKGILKCPMCKNSDVNNFVYYSIKSKGGVKA